MKLERLKQLAKFFDDKAHRTLSGVDANMYIDAYTLIQARFDDQQEQEARETEERGDMREETQSIPDMQPPVVASSVDPMDYMCIWEWYLDGKNTARLDLIETGEGVVSKRQWVVDELTPILNQAYSEACEHGFDDSYDWEFIPRFCSAMHSMVPFDDINDYNFTHLALKIAEGQIV